MGTAGATHFVVDQVGATHFVTCALRAYGMAALQDAVDAML